MNIFTLSYEEVIAVTQSTPMIISLIMIWLIPLILYFFMASSIRARTTNGRVSSKSMISNLNAVIVPILTWGVIQAGFMLILFVFPLWAKF